MNRNSANRVILVGHIGQDPEVRFTPNDVKTTSFTLATNVAFKNNDGSYADRTEWHKIVAWRKLAEYCGTLKKGQQIYIEGHLQTREWTDKENIRRLTTEIVADQLTMIGGRKKEAEEVVADDDQN